MIEAIAIVLLSWLLLDDQTGLASPGADAPTRHQAAQAPVGPDNAVLPVADAPSVSPVPTAEPTTNDTPAGSLPMGSLLHGAVHVVDAAPGDARLRETVWLTLKLDGAGSAQASATVTAEQPEFAWPAVPAGRYRLIARANGLCDATVDVEVPPGAANIYVDVELQPKWIVPVLLKTPDGRPLRTALRELPQMQHFYKDVFDVVALWHELPQPMPHSGRRPNPITVATWRSTSDFGNRSPLPARYAGQLEFPERRAAFVGVLLQDLVLGETALQPGQNELELVIDPASLTGALATLRLQVVGPDGAPLPDASIGVGTSSSSPSMQQPTAVDDEGRAVLTGLLPGTQAFGVSCKGFDVIPSSVVLPPGTTIDLGQLRLGRRLQLEFPLADPPAELSGTVTPLDAPPHPSLRATAQRVWVHDGKVQVVVAEGRYRLRLIGERGAVFEFDTRSLPEPLPTIALQPFAVLTIDLSTVTEPTHLEVHDEQGVSFVDLWLNRSASWDQRLPPGSYRATLQTVGGAARTQAIELPAEGATLRF